MLILSSDQSKPSDSNLVGFASFLGVKVRLLNSPTPAMLLTSPENLTPRAAIALSAGTLATLHREESSRESVLEKLLSFRTIFLYGIAATTHDELLRWLSNGSLVAAETVTGARRREFPIASKRFCHQLSGTWYVPAKSASTCDVVISGTERTVPLITVSAKPTFLFVQLGSCNLFVSTVATIPNPNQRVIHEDDI